VLFDVGETILEAEPSTEYPEDDSSDESEYFDTSPTGNVNSGTIVVTL